jgi:hypothetical protein
LSETVVAWTETAAVPLKEPEDAVIVLLPVATPAAKPELLILATALLEETQVTDAVRSCVLPSL